MFEALPPLICPCNCGLDACYGHEQDKPADHGAECGWLWGKQGGCRKGLA